MRCVVFSRQALLLAIAVAMLSATALTAQERKNTAVIPVPNERDKTWMPRHEKISARVKQGNVDLIFLGDSITEGWESTGKKMWEKLYARRNAVNAGIQSDRTQNVLWRLDHGNFDGITPKLAVLLIGTNSFGETPEQIVEGIQAIITKVQTKSPKTKVLVLCLFPRTKYSEGPKEINKLLPKLHNDKNVFVLDINHNFLAADGTLPKELFPDGLHPNAKGYQIWAESIEAIVTTLMGEKENPTQAVPLQLPNEAAGWMGAHEKINARVKQGNVGLIFIGDSITQGWELPGNKDVWEKFYGRRNAVNLGISRDRTQHILWRLEHGNLDGISPKLAVVMTGTGNADRSETEETPAGVKAVVDKLREKLPNTKVLLLGIFPRGPDNSYHLRQVNAKVNESLAKMGDDKMVFYLDIGRNFLAADGTLSKEVMPDLAHPSAKGYEIWAEAIEPTVARLMGEKENPTLPLPRLDVDWWMKRHELYNARAKESKPELIFIGDSITQGWELPGNKDVWEKYYGKRNALNLGISGDRTQHVLWRLDHGNIDGISPKLAVVMIGTNNSSRSNPEDIPGGVKAIIDRLRTKLPGTKILLLAIFPRGADKDDPWRRVNERVNEAIQKFADNKMVYWANINGLLTQPDGTLSKEIMPDLLHPNARGYEIWAEAIETMVGSLMGEHPSTVRPLPLGTHWWIGRYLQMNARIKQGNADLLFIGDSITHNWENEGKEVWQKFYGNRNAVNLGIGGDTTQLVLWRLDHGNIDGISPKLAVVMIGTNNTAVNTAEETADGVKAIVEKLRAKLPETKVLLLAIFPRGATDNPRRQTNAQVNEIISKLADGKSVFYLDIGQRFLGDGGKLSRDIAHDLLHLSAKGYEIWAESIEPMVAKLLGEKPTQPQSSTAPLLKLGKSRTRAYRGEGRWSMVASYFGSRT